MDHSKSYISYFFITSITQGQLSDNNINVYFFDNSKSSSFKLFILSKFLPIVKLCPQDICLTATLRFFAKNSTRH